MSNLLNRQIVSHKVAMKLKAAGFKQSSLFYYVNNWRSPRMSPISDGEHVIFKDRKHLTKMKGKIRGTQIEFVSAYTLAEILSFSIYKFELRDVTPDAVANTILDLVKDFEGANKFFNEKYDLEFRAALELEERGFPQTEFPSQFQGILPKGKR